MLNKRLLAVTLILLFGLPFIARAEEDAKWRSVSGKWRTGSDKESTYIVETKLRSRSWGYSELINQNSIVTLESLTGVTSIKFTLRFQEPVKSEVTAMAYFNVESYREFIGFRFSGNKESLNKAQFITSQIKDKSKPPSKKWNFKITEIETCECSLSYNKEYKMEIQIEKGSAALYIDGKKILQGKCDEATGSGKIGFSVKNAALRIDDVRAFNGKKIVFEDDFSRDTIKRIVVKGKLEKVED